MKYLVASPAKEIARQQRLLAALDRKFAPEIRKEIARASADLVAGYERTGSVPNATIEHEHRMAGLYLDMAIASIEAFGGRVVDQGKCFGLILEVKGFADFFRRIAQEYISGEAIRQRITTITGTTRAQIIRQITAGQADGLGVAEIARSITKRIPAISLNRGGTIARTETHGAANFGADQAARSTGLDLRKEWISVEDDRTRRVGIDAYGHASMNGQIRDMDQPFSMPATSGDPISAMFPGDPSLPAGASIHCRCGVGHIVIGLDE
tara:strand:- start:752 stop:1552 length:801 start_codon:yes stop_codon:yes gene_type:complete